MKNRFLSVTFCLCFIFWAGISFAQYNVAGNSAFIQNSQNRNNATPQSWYNPKNWWNWYKNQGLAVKIAIPAGVVITLGGVGYAVYRFKNISNFAAPARSDDNLPAAPASLPPYAQRDDAPQPTLWSQSNEQPSAAGQADLSESMCSPQDSVLEAKSDADLKKALALSLEGYGPDDGSAIPFIDGDLPQQSTSTGKQEKPIDSESDYGQIWRNKLAEKEDNAVMLSVAAQQAAGRSESVGLHAQAAQAFYEYIVHLGEYKPHEMMAYTNVTLRAISWHGITPENHGVISSFTDQAINEFTLRTVSQDEFIAHFRTLANLHRLSAILSLQRLQQLAEDNSEFQPTLQRFQRAVYDEANARSWLVPTNANTVHNRRDLGDLYAIQGDIDSAIAHWPEPSSHVGNEEAQRAALISFNIHKTQPKELPALLQHFALPRAEEIDVNTELLPKVD